MDARRVSAFLLIVLCSAPILCQAQRSVVVQVLNGKNGKPIRDRKFNVWLGDGGMLLLDTDAAGKIQLDVANVQPPKVRVNPNTRFDCRNKRDFGSGYKIEYSLDEILSKGIVGTNLCGSRTRAPVPGVLVIYLRPRTFIEKFMI
jgi:hypothetical protein